MKNKPNTTTNYVQLIPLSFTILALFAGFISILVSIKGMVETQPLLFSMSARLILLAMILDGIDGNLARYFKVESQFGAEFDTFVDVISFGVSPAILVYAVTFINSGFFIRILLPVFIVLLGAMRLSRFKTNDTLRGQGGYTGLPITANAAWVSLFVFVNQNWMANHIKDLSLFIVFIAGTIIFCLLQVSNIRYPKPTKKLMPFLFFIFLVALFCFFDKDFSAYVAVFMILLGLVYVIFAPFYIKK